jgi:hypothetical protein
MFLVKWPYAANGDLHIVGHLAGVLALLLIFSRAITALALIIRQDGRAARMYTGTLILVEAESTGLRCAHYSRRVSQTLLQDLSRRSASATICLHTHTDTESHLPRSHRIFSWKLLEGIPVPRYQKPLYSESAGRFCPIDLSRANVRCAIAPARIGHDKSRGFRSNATETGHHRFIDFEH